MKMRIKLNGIPVIGVISIGIIVLLTLRFRDIYRSQEEKLYSDAFVLFTKVVQVERQQAQLKTGFYDPTKSPNDIPEKEKAGWCDQDFLTINDPNRHVLDSLFQNILQEQNIQAKTAIRCIRKGIVIYSSTDSLIYKEGKLLDPIVYRTDENRNNDITLQAYVDISVWTVLKRMREGLVIPFLFLLWVGGAFRYLKKQAGYAESKVKQKEAELIELKEAESLKLQQAELVNQQQAKLIEQKEAELIELKEIESLKLQQAELVNQQQAELIQQKEMELIKLKETESIRLQQAELANQQQAQLIKQKEAELLTLQTQQKKKRAFALKDKNGKISLPCGLHFNEKQGILYYHGQPPVTLKGNSLKLFKCFIKAENYILTHENICTDVLGRSIKDGIDQSTREATFTTVYRLKDCLKPFPYIKIDSLRGTGYQMLFFNYQNDTILSDKSD